MGKECVAKALAVLAFSVCLCIAGTAGYEKAPETYDRTFSEEIDSVKRNAEQKSAEPETIQTTEKTVQMTDMTDAFDVILNGATKEFIAGYVIDRTFLMWLDAKYGDDVILNLAYCILDGTMEQEIWYELTGSSLHVLWLYYCGDTGFQSYRLKHVYWKDCADKSRTVIGFAGDINFADDWCTTEYMERQPGGIRDCFSEDLLELMEASDILLMNNEFAYTTRGTSLQGKDYVFRAQPDTVDFLSVFGTDVVTLANNHVYDYGETGLLDTLYYLKQAGLPYVGAGENIEEASQIVYFVANGRKIAIVSATEIERSKSYTKEATETECGVLKTLKPERFVNVIEEADKNSDYVIAVVHWGTEGALKYDAAQYRLAEKFTAAGADAVIGGHPHRLQGAGYVNGSPVAYSLGNFWFSTGALYTTLAQIVIAEDGALRLQYLPCIQKDMRTSLITEQAEKEEFYQYLASVSVDIGIDGEGYVYNKSAENYPAEQIACDSDTSETKILGAVDSEGNAIDIVGNLK